jgi:hypothetical protein
MANGAISADRADGLSSVARGSSGWCARMVNAPDAVLYQPMWSSSIPRRSDCGARFCDASDGQPIQMDSRLAALREQAVLSLAPILGFSPKLTGPRPPVGAFLLRTVQERINCCMVEITTMTQRLCGAT